MKEAPGFITGNELIDPGAFVLLHCFFYEYDLHKHLEFHPARLP